MQSTPTVGDYIYPSDVRLAIAVVSQKIDLPEQEKNVILEVISKVESGDQSCDWGAQLSHIKSWTPVYAFVCELVRRRDSIKSRCAARQAELVNRLTELTNRKIKTQMKLAKLAQDIERAQIECHAGQLKLSLVETNFQTRPLWRIPSTSEDLKAQSLQIQNSISPSEKQQTSSQPLPHSGGDSVGQVPSQEESLADLQAFLANHIHFVKLM